MRNGSLKLGSISGIPIYVHWTFSFLIAFVVYKGLDEQLGSSGITWLLGLTAAIFLCVLLHELGHSMAARRYGIETEDISLLPIGGLARLQEMPRQPTQELVIAIMGPMVNVAIAILLTIFIFIFGVEFSELPDPLHGPYTVDNFVILILVTNIGLVVFNMIPAFPMDGGRVFRAMLSYKLDYVKATQIASFVGRGMALGIVGLGFLWGDTMMMLVGTFVFFAANMENRVVSLEGALEGYKVRDLLRKRYTIFRTSETVRDALSMLYKGLERNFLIMDENNSLEGIITSKQLLDLKSTGLETLLGDIMRTDIAALETLNELKEVYALMRQKQQPIVPIFEEGLLMGVIDYQTVTDFIQQKK